MNSRALLVCVTCTVARACRQTVYIIWLHARSSVACVHGIPPTRDCLVTVSYMQHSHACSVVSVCMNINKRAEPDTDMDIDTGLGKGATTGGPPTFLLTPNFGQISPTLANSAPSRTRTRTRSRGSGHGPGQAHGHGLGKGATTGVGGSGPPNFLLTPTWDRFFHGGRFRHCNKVDYFKIHFSEGLT